MVYKSLDTLWFSFAGRQLRAATSSAVDLLLPQWCVGCQQAGDDLCAACTRDFQLATRRPFRADTTAAALPVVSATPEGFQVLEVWAAAPYQTLVAEVILAYKDHERVGLNRVLAPTVSGVLAHMASTCLTSEEALLVWPPTSMRARLRRGRDPLTELMTAAKLPDQFTPAPGLIRAGTTTPWQIAGTVSAQKTKSARARRAAVNPVQLSEGAAPQLRGRQVVLVDDVLTTGATLANLWKALTWADAEVCGAAVVAATP